MCGCDPYADKVIEALQESGLLCTQRDRERAILEARIEEAQWWVPRLPPFHDCGDGKCEICTRILKHKAYLARLGDAPGNAK